MKVCVVRVDGSTVKIVQRDYEVDGLGLWARDRELRADVELPLFGHVVRLLAGFVLDLGEDFVDPSLVGHRDDEPHVEVGVFALVVVRHLAVGVHRLGHLVDLDDGNLLASFRAGTNGLEAEERCREAGLTIGHWPQSIALSTVGGWVATRAAGQFSTGYGSIEDLVFALEAVLADGAVLRTRGTPRAAAGPDLRELRADAPVAIAVARARTSRAARSSGSVRTSSVP